MNSYVTLGGFWFVMIIATCAPASKDATISQPKPSETPSNEIIRTSSIAPEEEQRSLELISQVLLWSYRWKLRLSPSQENSATDKETIERSPVSWIDRMKAAEGKIIKVSIEETPAQLVANLEDLGLRIRLNRTAGTNLMALRPEQLPRETRAVDKYWLLQVPLAAQSRSFSTKDDRMKARLLEAIEALALKNACFSLSNSSDEEIRITVPNFNIGDPELYLLLQGNKTQYSNGASIDWIRFEMRGANSEFVPILDKNFGLPDEVDSYRQIIENTKLKTLIVDCSSTASTK